MSAAQPTLTAGQTFGSKNEAHVYAALQKRKVDFTYQYPLAGGSGVRGGQILDFVVWLPPKPKAVYVGAEGYWHVGRRNLEDELKHVQAERFGFETVDLTTEETNTQTGADRAVQEKVM